MTSKQTDTVAMTEEQLDAVAGGYLSVYTNVASMGGGVFAKLDGVQGGIMRKGSSVSINPISTPISKVLGNRGQMGVAWPEF